MDGSVWVDSAESPRVFHALHPYGMSLVWGSAVCDCFEPLAEHLRQGQYRAGDEWLQVDPRWDTAPLERMLNVEVPGPETEPAGPRVQRDTRVNSGFERSMFEAKCAGLRTPDGMRMRRMTAAEFALPGVSVSPHRFWRDAEQFLGYGGGWCIEKGGQVCAIAFCSFREDMVLEIGVETLGEFRGRGLGAVAAKAIIQQCLEAGLEPVWACRKENAGSYALAIRMGFLPALEIPFCRLPVPLPA